MLTGEVDMALGGDQGGSIRMPAAWTGIVGLKPTFGLVPYTGILGAEPCVDHVGPMARTVADCALLLGVRQLRMLLYDCFDVLWKFDHLYGNSLNSCQWFQMNLP